MSGQNWYEISVQLPEHLASWVKTNVPEDQIKETPSPHITLLYGFDPKYYDEIDKLVKEAKIVPEDYTFGEPKKGDVSPVWLMPVVSPKLSSLFWYLYCKYDNEHTLINGKFEPHVTLCWLKHHTL
jgi:hypothetical protein